jgi:hypothetical protein
LIDPVTDSRTVRTLFVGSLLTVVAGLSTTTAWLVVWPAWQSYRAVHALIESVKNKDGLTFIDATPHGTDYLTDFDRMTRVVGEVRSVGGADEIVNVRRTLDL